MGNPVLGTDLVCQIGLLVNNIEKSSKDWAEFLGMDVPEFIITGTREEAETKFMGEDSEARAKLAFFPVWPNVTVELIEPDRNPSTWRNDLDKNGEGFHHIAFVIKGMKEKIEICGKQGFKLLQTGEYTGGRYAYMDANDKLKLVLELLEND